MTPVALLDSNVLIAAVAGGHVHHAASIALFTAGQPERYAFAAHSIAEAFSTLTRLGETALFRVPAEKAWMALERLRMPMTLIGLTPAQTFETVRVYAKSGGTSPRLYDALIGEVAVANKISAIVTWNTRHMTGLFPALRVLTPTEFQA